MDKTDIEIIEEICGKCMHYFYMEGKKTHSEQKKVCQRAEGQCKKLLSEAIKIGYKKEKPKTWDDIEAKCPNKQVKGRDTVCILTNKSCSNTLCPKLEKK